ncbi:MULTISPECIES: GntR family transcriptional regulator [Nocardiopsis]|jgi:GntR family transcriptional regulator|uniref:GntR family transcriptional regulator n=1 Tax=Nocardiopsis alba TaxID=53437 RepID=A0A7K2IUZ9_9ACTN|nr:MULTISPECIES: GntR family transcriptional regulator [Nocardiopsis]MEC3895220.1 GntR family transcriptional regulator [Nocardiopsis sp. LDBS1602]MYR33667.1 GntR family transcriptional regulator [Nocardiopsis alba]
MRAESRYRQIARTLRREIQGGSLPPGGQLPSEKQLEERFEASRNTVRLALGMLRNQGLIVSRPGRGHYVQDVVPETFYATRGKGGPGGLNESNMSGLTLEELQLLSADTAVASRLRVPEGTMTVVRRMHRFSGGRSGSISSAFYPMDLVENTPLMLPEDVESALEVLMEHGHRQVGYVDELATRMPTPQEVDELELPPGVPVLTVHRTDYSTERPIRLVHTVYAGHSIRYQFEHGDLKAYHRD